MMRSFLKIAIITFLVLLAGNAFAIDNRRNVVSPYWQVDSGSYSFIAVSHSSLSGMNSQIGIKLTAIDSGGTSYGTAAEFTINAGTTQRVFIVPTSHATLNPTALTDSDVNFIRGTNNYSYGSIKIEPIASHPEKKFIGAQSHGHASIQIPSGMHQGFRDATMLSYWGSVVVEAQTTGFAMEFIGDMNDSIGGLTNCNSFNHTGTGIATHICASSGVNLQ